MNNMNNVQRRLTLKIARYYLNIKDIKRAQEKISQYWRLTRPESNSYEPFYIALYGSSSEKAKTLFENGVIQQPDYPL